MAGGARLNPNARLNNEPNIKCSFVGASNTGGSAQYMFLKQCRLLGRDGLAPGGYTDVQMCLVDLQSLIQVMLNWQDKTSMYFYKQDIVVQ